MSKIKVYVSPSNQSANAYATGNTNEREQCHKIAAAVVGGLTAAGFDVKCTYNDAMEQRIKESNAFGAALHIAIHTNATTSHTVTGGTQVLLYDLTGERYKIGKCVFDCLSKITPGTSAEKIIAMPLFAEINSVKGITVYCECEFHDTKTGSDFIINNTDKIADAIVTGICKYYNVSRETSKPAKLYRVQLGAFKDRSNAENFLKQVRLDYPDAFITE